MEYSKEFINLVDTCSEKGLYIGTGNPNSNILIIGKECAHNFNKCEACLIKQDFLDAANCEVSFNCSKWLNALSSDIEIVKIQNWDRDWTKYDVRYPFKGQKRLLDNQINNGTSDTWLNYQTLIESIVGYKGECIDFHKHCFITEINQIPAPNSKLLDKYVQEEVKEAVKKRKYELFVTHRAFFQKFPIVIIAGLSYPTKYKWDFCSLFDVAFTEKKGEKPRQQFWIHSGQDDQKRMLIHTRQMSMDISNDLIQDIANICKRFIKDNKIEI